MKHGWDLRASSRCQGACLEFKMFIPSWWIPSNPEFDLIGKNPAGFPKNFSVSWASRDLLGIDEMVYSGVCNPLFFITVRVERLFWLITRLIFLAAAAKSSTIIWSLWGSPAIRVISSAYARKSTVWNKSRIGLIVRLNNIPLLLRSRDLWDHLTLKHWCYNRLSCRG